MILDHIRNWRLYTGLGDRISAGLSFVSVTTPGSLLPGRFEIDGDLIYGLFQEYIPHTLEAGKWEAHRKYIDIQYMVAGEERIHYSNIRRLIPGIYDRDHDFQGFSGEGPYIDLMEGFFMILFPEDAHKPGIMTSERPSPVQKLVVKVAV